MKADPMREKSETKLPLIGEAPLLAEYKSGAMME